MPGNVLHDLNCILEHWCFPINASLQHVRTCTPTHRSSTFTIQYITIFQPDPALDSPNIILFFSDGFPWTLSSRHWNAWGPQWKTTWKKPWYRRGGFPSFPVAIGPMNLVPSVKPGVGGAQCLCEMTTWEGFFPQSGKNPPKSHHLSPVSGVSQEILEGIGGLGLGDRQALSGTYVLEQRDSKYFVRNLELLQFWRACILVNMDLECSKRCLHERCQWNWIIAVSNW